MHEPTHKRTREQLAALARSQAERLEARKLRIEDSYVARRQAAEQARGADEGKPA